MLWQLQSVCPTVHHFVQTAWLEVLFALSPLVWSEVQPLKCSLWLLIQYQCCSLTRIPLRYPVVALCHGGPAALDLQDWSLHSLQQFIDGVDVVVGRLRALDLGLGGSGVVIHQLSCA